MLGRNKWWSPNKGRGSVENKRANIKRMGYRKEIDTADVIRFGIIVAGGKRMSRINGNVKRFDNHMEAGSVIYQG